MTNLFADLSQRKAARIAGLLYLILIVSGVLANYYVRMGLIVPGDVEPTDTPI